MLILGIESSCDDTCASVVENGTIVHSNIISSQNQFHEKYGGVVPEIASRKHLNVITEVIDDALSTAGKKIEEIDLIAATAFHGLTGSLLVGLMAAKTIAYMKQKPFLALNHIEGHIYANYIDHPEISFPHICLTVSGGHTLLILVKGHGKYEKLGETVDDSAGEAFDKTAQYLEIGFPGGPVIDKLAKEGNRDKYILPRPMLYKNNYQFSFSGLKTAVLNLIKELKDKEENFQIQDICASFQQAVVDVLVKKTMKAAKQYQAKAVTLSGGVAANSMLRQEFTKQCGKEKIEFYTPKIPYCMDNGAMIACLAYHRFRENGKTSPLSTNATANISLFS